MLIYIYIRDFFYIYILLYIKTIKNNIDVGGVLTERFGIYIYIYIYDLVSIQHLDGAPA